jgi:GNAT superfamily N-acetyltransferase
LNPRSAVLGAVYIRQATRADAAELVRLNTLFNGEGDLTADQLARYLERCKETEVAYLADVNGSIVGFACLRLVPTLFSPAPYAELTELFVEAPFRRQGIGRALLHYGEAVARAAGAEELFLMTGFKNTPAHHFYHALGYSLRCFTMHKSLTITH